MIFPKAKKIAKDLGWHKTADNVFGLYKGYFFNVSDASLISTPQSKYITVTTGGLTEDQKLQIKTGLVTNKKKLKFTSFEIRDSGVFFQFVENLAPTKVSTVYALLDFVTDLFKKLNISEQNKCHSCETSQGINHYSLNDTGIILCDSCFKETDDKFQVIDRERISKEKNYWAGLSGAILFSVPGIALWVLLAVYLGRIGSGMAFFITFLGLLGYDYFKGRQGKPTRLIIFLINVASIVIANVMTVIALLMKQGSTTKEALLEFQTNEAVKEVFYTNIVLSFILASAVWIWILFFMKKNQLIIKPADKF